MLATHSPSPQGCKVGHRRRCRVAVISMFWTIACAPDELPHFGTLRYESPEFEVWAVEELEACGGTYDYMQRWLHEFRDQTGANNPGPRSRFYWVTTEDLEPDACPSGRACAHIQDSIIYSTEIPLEHEFVHLELEHRPPSFLREGAAEVFGSIRPPYESTVIDIEQFLDDPQIPGQAYESAGRFSRYLIDRFGPDQYFELYAHLDGQTTTEQIDAGIQHVLGVERPALFDDFGHLTSCSVDRWRFFDLECNTLPPEPWVDSTHWEQQFDLSCSSESVVGPQQGSVWTRRALDVAEAGSYLLAIESEDPTAQVGIFSCDSSCFDGQPYSPLPPALVSNGGQSSVFLNVGRYWLQVTKSVGADASASVQLTRR